MSEALTSTAPKIVVVDDDHELLKLISMLLRRIGAEAHAFSHGQEALAFLQDETPDMVVLDLMLPDVDGLEILRQIRAQPRFETMPILILSAKADPNTIRQGLDQGADGYVTKPYIANSLIDRVRLLLRVGRQPGATVEQPSHNPSHLS
ncbi:MAG: response regulator [Chloroflexi bacterium]|nr:response regulator [Chloroflexota bacterium]